VVRLPTPITRDVALASIADSRFARVVGIVFVPPIGR
jgi:hypothetical protein